MRCEAYELDNGDHVDIGGQNDPGQPGEGDDDNWLDLD